LTPATRDMHRAILSLMEELEAVDWYQQRIDAAQDDELRGILEHNRDDEIEHASMLLEWLRRHHPSFEEKLRPRLFTDLPILEGEERLERAAALRELRTGGGGSTELDSKVATVGSLRNDTRRHS
jgi:hypothetical protein